MEINITVISGSKSFVLRAEKGTRLLEVLQKSNIPIVSPCAGSGSCGKCKVKVKKGQQEISSRELDFLSEEEVKKGYRLACYLVLDTDLEIELPGEEELEVLTEAIDINIEFNPHLSLHGLPEDIRKDPAGKAYGLAVDLGTTTVALYLINLFTGEEVAVDSFANPQKKYGADVIRRIDYAHRGKEELVEIQEILIRELNLSIEKLAAQNRISTDSIYSMTIVGNTVMNHLLAGVDPHSLAIPPFRPVFTDSRELSPADLNIKINPQGVIKLLPTVSAYLGSDIIADLLLLDFDREEWNLLLDIGTNGEIVLGRGEKLLACTAAAGPAFGGASISYGVAGIPGAISSFSINEGREFKYETIKEQKAVGICGSGLIDIVAALLEHGFISKTGLIREDLDQDLFRIRDYQDIKAIELLAKEDTAIGSPIFLTQKDIREVQLAKAAIAAGVNILIKEAGIRDTDIANVYLAGGFGSYINPASACKIGLLPGMMEKRIRKIGNAAGHGARLYLLDKRMREKAELLAEKIGYLELATRGDFQAEFIRAMDF